MQADDAIFTLSGVTGMSLGFARGHHVCSEDIRTYGFRTLPPCKSCICVFF